MPPPPAFRPALSNHDQNRLCEELAEAASAGSLPEIERLLALGADPLWSDSLPLPLARRLSRLNPSSSLFSHPPSRP